MNDSPNSSYNKIKDQEKSKKSLSKDKFSIFLITATGWLVMLGSTSLLTGLIDIYIDKSDQKITLEERIIILTKSLNNAASIISEIEMEVEKRQTLVERLQQDAQTAQAMIDLNAKEAEAVAQVLRKEIDREQTQSFWADLVQNMGFTVLGVFLGEAVAWWRRRRAEP
jgi:hypothetical protein